MYDLNGKHLISSSYFHGIRDGLTVLYFDSGQKACKINYRSGVIEGKVQGYYEDGTEYNPKGGFLTTTYKLKYNKDSIWRLGEFRKNTPSGKQVQYANDGSVQHEIAKAKDLSHTGNYYYGIFQSNIDPNSKERRSIRSYKKYANKSLNSLFPKAPRVLEELNRICDIDRVNYTAKDLINKLLPDSSY